MAINVSVQYNGGLLPDIIMLNQCYCHRGTRLNARKKFLKKNQNAPRPSEHPPVRGKKRSKRLGGIIGCNYKISSWHLIGFPYGTFNMLSYNHFIPIMGVGKRGVY